MKRALVSLGLPGLLMGAAFVAPSAGIAQPGSEDIVIYGRYRDRVPDRSPSASQVVSYADLDLSTGWGRDELKHRVRLAARYLCDKLNEGPAVGAADDCRSTAYRDAMDRIGTVEQHFAPRGTAWVRPAPWTAPWTADWASRYPDDGR